MQTTFVVKAATWLWPRPRLKRPGQPIHQPPVRGVGDSRRGQDQHGRPGPGTGLTQYLRRAAVEEREVRGSVPA
mgnify:CR=1 FL=1|jgi:hypothetical protein